MSARPSRGRLEFLCAAFDVIKAAVLRDDGRLALAALVRVVQVASAQDADEVVRSLVIAKVLPESRAAQLRDAAGLVLVGGAR